MKITPEHRAAAQQAREQEDTQRRARGQRVTQRFQALADERRAKRAAERKFATTFNQLPFDVWTLMQVLRRCTADHTHLDRRANMLRLRLAKGAKPKNPADVVVLAQLTGPESRMTDEEFVRYLDKSWPRPQERFCENPTCLRREGRTRVAVSGSARFCSPICRASRQAVNRRRKNVV